MALRKGLPAKLAATDADDTRYDLSGLIVCNTDGTPRGGVLSPVGANLVTATATMNVSVARFQGAAIRDAGVVLLANDGPTNVLHEPSPPANSRIDVVWGKQNDASSTVSVPDANNLSAFGITKGAAVAVPVKPAIPAGTVELATVQIPSTATATNSPGVVITQTAPFTAAAGGVVPFRTKAELDLWTSAAQGQRAVVLADNGEYVWTAADWLVRDATPRVHAATFNNLTVGNGTVRARSQRFGRLVHCWGFVKLGTTSAIGSGPQLVLPYQGIAEYAVAGSNYPLGRTGMLDRGAQYYEGPLFTQGSSTWVQLAAYGANGAQASITPSYPFAWSGAAGDELSWNFWYEMS